MDQEDQVRQDAQTDERPDGVYITSDAIPRIQELSKEFDEFRRFMLEMQSERVERGLATIERGSAIYEKLILVDGTAIALSMSFLGSLSTHLSQARTAPLTSLWMIALSWCLLLISIYCCYRVIIDRHKGRDSLLLMLAKEQEDYVHDKLAAMFSRLGGCIKGEIAVKEEKVNLGQMLIALGKGIASAKEKQGQARLDQIKIIKQASSEVPMARWAISCTLLAVLILCVFTIHAMHLLF